MMGALIVNFVVQLVIQTFDLEISGERNSCTISAEFLAYVFAQNVV